MLNLKVAKQFIKDLRKSQAQNKPMSVLRVVMTNLAEEKTLDPKYLDHPLQGNWVGCRECHLTNNWLLIYRLLLKEQEIWFERLGSHAELFG
jgi:mRNA interferase YafQ